MTCNSPDCKKPIEPSDRHITIAALTVKWGDDDLRGEWTGPYVFCAFGCLSDWASEKAADHDGRVVREGT